MTERDVPADASVAFNAVTQALGHQREEILDAEITFAELIDAVIGVTTGTPVEGAEARDWAVRFVAENQSWMQQLTLDSDNREAVHRLSYQFTLPPIPARIERRAQRRASYDAAVIEGLGTLGLEVTEIDYLRQQLFISTWTGRDGGRVDIHEHDSLPVRVVNFDFENRKLKRLFIHGIEADDDPMRDAESVIAAVKRLWE